MPGTGLTSAKVGASLAKVDAAKAAGQSVTLDVYPYTAGSGRMIEYFNLDRIDVEYAQVIRIANCPSGSPGRGCRDSTNWRSAAQSTTGPAPPLGLNCT